MIRLGQTEMNVSPLGYGSMGLRGPNTWGVRVVDESQAERVLHAVLDAGINFIDTAPDYGICEQRIGQYLAGRRAEYYLATKCGCTPIQHDDHLEVQHTWTRDTVLRNVDTSLQRMRTDYLDLIQFHGGRVEQLQQAGLLETLQELKSQGIVRYIGVSTKLPDAWAHVQLGVYDTIQLPFSCLAPEHAPVMRAAHERGLGVIIRGGIAHGGPDAVIRRPKLEDIWRDAQLDELLPPGMSRAELLLRFTLGQPHCHTTIVGTCDLEHLAGNVLAAARGALPTELQAAIRDRLALGA